MKKFLCVLTAWCALSAPQILIAAGDPEAGKQKILVCNSCHGEDGNSIAPNFPNLAGQGEQYTLKQLQDFKSSLRTDPTMNGMVLPLSGQDMADIAAYYAQQTPKPAVADEAKVALGQSIYRGGITTAGIPACASCHGPAGQGNPAAAYPALAGQHAAYIEKTLYDFQSGARSNDPNSMMRALVKRMTKEEIQAVSSYIQGLYSK